jgi:hypothetical protein
MSALDLEAVLHGLRGRRAEPMAQPPPPSSGPVQVVRPRDLTLTPSKAGTVVATPAADGCAACEGSGHVFVVDNGYSFAHKCRCELVREAASRITRACIPAAFLTATGLKPMKWQLDAARFVRDHYTGTERPTRGMILHGRGVGTGKSTLAAMAIQHCTMRGLSGRWVSWDGLHLRLAEAQRAAFGSETDDGDRNRADVVRDLSGCSVLVIDDVKDTGDKGVGAAEEIIGARWNASTGDAPRFTIVTTNLPLPALDAALGPRVMSRLRGSNAVFEITGADVRQAQP